MDVESFGTFLQSRRKELGMKQADLAQKLHVTDKAISRWERGVGFPDIKLLEPLARALEISLTELLQCKVMEQPIPEEQRKVLEAETEQIMEQQQKLSWQRRLVLWLGYAAIVAASWVLISITRIPALSFEQRRAVYAIAFFGGSLGCRALQYIVERLYLKNEPWGIWHKQYTRISVAVGLVGFWLAVNSWMIRTPAPVWNMWIFVAGVVILIGAWIYYAFQKEKEEE